MRASLDITSTPTSPELPGFNGDPQKSNESKLEAIQMAWPRNGRTGKPKEKSSVFGFSG